MRADLFLAWARRAAALALVLLGSAVSAQGPARLPSIGYLYPAGGQRGTTFHVLAGGQNLRGAERVHVTGEGVRVRVRKHAPPIRNLNRERVHLLRRNLQRVWDRRLDELLGADRPASVRMPPFLRPRDREMAMEMQAGEAAERLAEEERRILAHPFFEGLEDMSLRQLGHLAAFLIRARRTRQPNRQIAELLLLEVTIDADASLGDRELRVQAAGGLSNPRIFRVGAAPEVRELEPNDREAYPDVPGLPPGTAVPAPLELPVVLNGQVMPGDVDSFRFRARAGQRVVMEVRARRLVPYLADAVPGWFQATLSLYDERGRELAYADDFRFDPDPVLVYEIPADGTYELAIHDSLYRGREDFVYRITLAERPYPTRLFPLGASAGSPGTATASGWNMAPTRLSLDTSPGGPAVRRVEFDRGADFVPALSYAVVDLPSRPEQEPDDRVAKSRLLGLPLVVDGRISPAGDVDVFSFRGRRGQRLVLEVTARRLGSPLDSLVRLTDEAGAVLAWNDDHVEKVEHLHRDPSGLVTHHADSYLTTRLPADGTYRVRLSDARGHGGEDHAYRLRISGPRPDYELRLTPSSLTVPPGGSVPLHVHALRKDGFRGSIHLRLRDSQGFTLDGGMVPAGKDHVVATLQAPRTPRQAPVSLELVGRASVAGQGRERRAVPADDVMQAFLYRHLVPARELLVGTPKRPRRLPPVRRVGPRRVRLTRGETARIDYRLRLPRRAPVDRVALEILDPPPGFNLAGLEWTDAGVALALSVEPDAGEAGEAGNLIVQAFLEPEERSDESPRRRGPKRRILVTTFPALPYRLE